MTAGLAPRDSGREHAGTPSAGYLGRTGEHVAITTDERPGPTREQPPDRTAEYTATSGDQPTGPIGAHTGTASAARTDALSDHTGTPSVAPTGTATEQDSGANGRRTAAAGTPHASTTVAQRTATTGARHSATTGAQRADTASQWGTAGRPERVVRRACELIGRTPLFELTRTGTGTRLLLKLEQFNPTGSAKIRMAREMVLHAERTGLLRPGGHIVEPTSGNTGTGLALVALERGYTFTAVVDGHAARDKLRAMRALGARLVHVEGGDGGPSTVARRRKAAEIAAATGAYWPDQHNNPGNGAGYRGLAEELRADLDADIDWLIGAVGTGGSLCGTVDELRRHGSRVRTIGVEPAGSIIFGGTGRPYWQTGAGSPAGFRIGRNVDYRHIDEGCKVADADAFATARIVARRTGLLVGGTAGAAIHIALRRLLYLRPGGTVVVLVCDAGEKYLDSVYDDDWLLERGLLDHLAHQRTRRLLTAYDDSVRLAGGSPPTGHHTAGLERTGT